jgi:hypothetical protein
VQGSVEMQLPAAQTSWALQDPQDPVHPSEPHVFPLQSGTQPPTHLWLNLLQVAPFAHVPQEPPHPSLPHSLPAQSGLHVHAVPVHWYPDWQVPHCPPHPSGPHCFPVHAFWQAHFPATQASWGPGHFPHDPPHPSSPHALPPHAGVQAPQ